MQHDHPLVMYLGTQLFNSYCNASRKPTRSNITYHLLDAMSVHLKMDIICLPDCEVLYNAHNGKLCGSATKEKMVLLLYLKTKPEQRETLFNHLQLIGNRQRLTETPYWDNYKKEHAHIINIPAPVVLTEPFEECLSRCPKPVIDKLLKAVKEVAKKKREE